MVTLARQEHCTGCGVCSAVCPVQAIIMIQDKEDGFYKPSMDTNTCIECGKCVSVCPMLHQLTKQKPYYGKVYAAINQNEKMRDAAASGGLFAAFAERIIERGGCVAGVVYDKNLNVIHRLAEDREGLAALFGSKYMQSDMRYIYNEVYEKLVDGKEVLFCGTPCQVAGIKRFAEEKKREEKLTTIDLLCRGVPSPKAFHKYLEMMEKQYGKQVTYIKFKDNEKGWHNINTRIIMEDGSEDYLSSQQCTYLSGFLDDNMTVRESCFHCVYKKIERQGDITIGDFWGLRNTDLVDDKGTSLVVLNSEKGAALWEDTKQLLLYKESTMWRVVQGNRMAFVKLPENPTRQKFWEYLEQHDYNKALEMARQYK